MPKVSVIIPIYGVEKYIERCSRSLFEQTLEDMEFVFVNDCTKDKSLEVLEHTLADYPLRQSQVKILNHETNKGLPQARMTGIAQATGEYIAHCDSDDWVDVTMYERLYNVAEKDGYDMVVSDYFIIRGNDMQKVTGCYMPQKESFIHDLMFSKISWAVWNKMVKRSIYDCKQLICPKGSMSEDMVFTLQLANTSQSIGYVESPLYYYRVNEKSMTIQTGEEAILKKYKQVCDNIDIIEKYSHQYMEYNFIKDGLLHIKISQGSLLKPLLNQPKHYALWKKIVRGHLMQIFMSSQLPVKDKTIVLLIISRIIPYLINQN